jgi:aromatic ring-opening dioxygenase LigB subunit
MTIVLGAIAPHGTPAFEPGPTREAMEELGQRAEAARPDAIVVLTPHNVHVERHFAVVTAARAAGSLAEWERPETLEREVDRELALAIRAELEPAVSVSFGGNDPAEAVMPMDWGALIPLWFLPELPVVIVSPARDLPLAAHRRAGEAIARATGTRRVLLVASADHGHAHDPDGPYGFDPASAQYDERVVELVRENRLDRLPELESLVGPAQADSLWQMVVLGGALGEDFESELLSYDAPTYFGMLAAAFAPRARARVRATRPRAFDAYVAVDWSAESKPKLGRDSVWVAERVDGRTEARNVATRAAATDVLLELLTMHVAAGRRVLIGFDFPYGYPVGFADRAFPGHGPPWLRVWTGLDELVSDDARNANNRYEVAAALNRRVGAPGPFWGCPSALATDALLPTKRVFPHAGLEELRAVERRMRGLQPVWKLAYPASVGSQALLGIPRLRRLRFAADLERVSAVWPFETDFRLPHGPQVVHAEIWPGTVPELPSGRVRDEAQVRAVVGTWADADDAGQLGRWFERPDGLDDAAAAAAEREEGWILGVR